MKKKSHMIKLSKAYTSFTEAMKDVITFKPQLKQIFLGDLDPDTVTKEEFYDNFSNIIDLKNPIEPDNRLWEYHIGQNKFHINTNNFFSLGMNQLGENNYIFFIILFGNYQTDLEYLTINGWEVMENDTRSSQKTNEVKSSETVEEETNEQQSN